MAAMADGGDIEDSVDDASGGEAVREEPSHEEEVKAEVPSKRRRFLNIILFKSLRKRLFPGWRRSKKGVGRKVKSTSDVLTAHHDERGRGSHFNNKISTSADSIFTRERGHHGSMGMLDSYMDGMDDSQLEEDFFKGKWSTNISANVTCSGDSTVPVDLDAVGEGTSLDTAVARHKMALRPPKKKAKNRQRATSPSPTLPVLSESEVLTSPTAEEVDDCVPSPVTEMDHEEEPEGAASPVLAENTTNEPVVLRRETEPMVPPGVTMRSESVQRDPTKRQTIATERTIFGERKVNRPSSVHGAPVRDWDAVRQPHSEPSESVGETEFAKMFSKVRHNTPQQVVKEADSEKSPSSSAVIKEDETVKTKAVIFKDGSSGSPQGSPAFKRDSPLVKDRGRSRTLPKSNFATPPPSDNQVKVKRVASHRVTPERRDDGTVELPVMTKKIIPPISDHKNTAIVIEKKPSPEVVKKLPEVVTSPERTAIVLEKKSPLVTKRPVEGAVKSTSPERTPTEIVIEKKPSAVARTASQLRKMSPEKSRNVETKGSPESNKGNILKPVRKTSPERTAAGIKETEKNVDVTAKTTTDTTATSKSTSALKSPPNPTRSNIVIVEEKKNAETTTTTKPDETDTTPVATGLKSTPTSPVVHKPAPEDTASGAVVSEKKPSSPEMQTKKDDSKSPPQAARKTPPKKLVVESNDSDVPVWFAMARRKTQKFEDGEAKRTSAAADAATEKTDSEPEAGIVLRESCGTAPAANRKSKVMDLVKNWQNLQVS